MTRRELLDETARWLVLLAGLLLGLLVTSQAGARGSRDVIPPALRSEARRGDPDRREIPIGIVSLGARGVLR